MLDNMITNHIIIYIDCMLSSTSSCGCSSLISIHLVCEFFIKILIIIIVLANIHRPYVCDHLVPYISLVNNSIDSITPYWLTIIIYSHIPID